MLDLVGFKRSYREGVDPKVRIAWTSKMLVYRRNLKSLFRFELYTIFDKFTNYKRNYYKTAVMLLIYGTPYN